MTRNAKTSRKQDISFPAPKVVGKVFVCALTEIFNRHYFDEITPRIINTLSRSCSSLSLMMADIDFFKSYNDTYGQAKGDDCLKAVADALSQSLTRADDFVARYDLDKFVVVLPNTDSKGAWLLADKLLNSVRELNIPYEKSNVANCVTISIGVITGVVSHTHKADDYVIQAEKMLNESKQNRRDRYTIELMDSC